MGDMAPERLQKLMAAAGLCSRRQAETLLRQGLVQVNGTVAQLGDQADPAHDRISTILFQEAAWEPWLLNGSRN